MKDYFSLFVDLSLQQCKKNDYADKLKVRKANATTKKLIKLQDEMRKSINEELLDALLNHEDDRVKVNAASFCLKSQIMIEQAVLTLESIKNDSDDSMISFTAEMVLKLYREGSLFRT